MSTSNNTRKVTIGAHQGGQSSRGGRRYSLAEREQILAVYCEHGLQGAAERTGVSRHTIKAWALENGVTPRPRRPLREVHGPRLPLAPLLSRFRHDDDFRSRCHLPKSTFEHWRIDGIPFYKADRICCKVLRVPMVDLWPDHYPAVTTSEDDVWCAVWAAGGDPEASPEDGGPWIDAAVQTVVQPRLAFEMAS